MEIRDVCRVNPTSALLHHIVTVTLFTPSHLQQWEVQDGVVPVLEYLKDKDSPAPEIDSVT